MGLAAFVHRLVDWLRTTGHSPSAAELFRRADQLRNQGRSDEAGALVDQGLRRSPQSVAGHLLAGYLHLTSGRLEPARRAFDTVLALDPDHPRALLGLARVALEEGRPGAARPYVDRALQYHADFAEAKALSEALAGQPAGQAEVRPFGLASQEGPRQGSARDRFVVPLDGRGVSSPGQAGPQTALDWHLLRIARVATATLGRAGLGPLRKGVIESAHGATFLQSDGTVLVAVTLPAGTPTSEGFSQLGRLSPESSGPDQVGNG